MNMSADRPARSTPDACGAEQLEPMIARALELRDEGREDGLEEAGRPNPRSAELVRSAVERVRSLTGWSDLSTEPVISLGTRFRLLGKIGAGAMGIVYLAEDLELRRKVACKVVHHGLIPPEQAVARCAREAEATAAVQHPAIVTIHDRGRTESGQVYIVMELVEGAPLTEFLDAASAREERERRSPRGVRFGHLRARAARADDRARARAARRRTF
jgi:hypothetical protein